MFPVFSPQFSSACSPCNLTWGMAVALSACHRSHRSARVVSITLKISNTVWNNINPHFYSNIKRKSAFISVDEALKSLGNLANAKYNSTAQKVFASFVNYVSQTY